MSLSPVACDPVLVVEDDAASARRMRRLLQDVVGGDVRVDVAGDAASAHGLLRAGTYPLALVDVDLPDGSGIDLIGWIGAQALGTAAVIVSA